MLAIVLALLLATNTITYFIVSNKSKKITQAALDASQQSEQDLAAFKKENQDLRQELADLRYKNRELEKDLAAAKR